MGNDHFSHDEIERTRKLSDELVKTAIDRTKTPREALLALVRAASTISIVHQIPPQKILKQIFESMSN